MESARKLFVAAVLAAALYLISPLLLPVAMGGVLAILLVPWLEKLEKRRFKPSLAASLLSLGVTLVIVLPAVLLVILGARMTLDQVRILRDVPHLPPGVSTGVFEKLLEVPALKPLVDLITGYFPVESQEIARTLSDVAQGIAIRVAGALGDFLTQLPSYALGMVIMLVANYFFLVDGKKLVTFVRANSFFTTEQTERLLRAFVGSCRSVILASIVSGFAQSALFAIAALVVGRSQVPLIGFAIFFASFVPLIGSAPVTLGVALHQFFTVGHPSGIVLLAVAALVGVIDNVIRAAVMRGSANLHPLLGFIAVFGGLQVMGFAGVFLGPILASLAMAMIDVLTVPTRPASPAGSGPRGTG
jgi:predicted PurR-regulated permease PerM